MVWWGRRNFSPLLVACVAQKTVVVALFRSGSPPPHAPAIRRQQLSTWWTESERCAVDTRTVRTCFPLNTSTNCSSARGFPPNRTVPGAKSICQGFPQGQTALASWLISAWASGPPSPEAACCAGSGQRPFSLARANLYRLGVRWLFAKKGTPDVYIYVYVRTYVLYTSYQFDT
ncbi:hypothetical protein FN846DRAFT_375082 [Sphaerosporella brunnea]|uniref:Secreted protein n=1 Tax=Sphaerosporella brunnea TaxID=1250544 RepID=A0A5J5EGJ4_9PEZI|nr:hypothetical protein FN846DRAFT_375082 [Sphaerosporella brunnea]